MLRGIPVLKPYVNELNDLKDTIEFKSLQKGF